MTPGALYQALQEVTDDLEDGDTGGWDPYEGTTGDLRTSEGFSRWGVDRLTILLPPRGEVYGKVLRQAWSAYLHTKKRHHLRVDFNPARVSSDGLHPCPVDDVPTAVAMVLEAASAFADIGAYSSTEILKAKITRLDLTRDLEGVLHASTVIDALARLPRPRGLRAETFNNGRVVWRPNGLGVGTGNEAVLYDRSVLYRSTDDWALKERRRGRGIEVPEGVLRFEARFRDDWLRRAAFGCLADVTAPRALDALRERWRWARSGTPVADQESLLAAIRATDWTEREKADHLWFELTRQPGRDPETSPRKRRDHRRRVAEIGIGARLDGIREVRLDFDAGTEVVANPPDAAIGA